PGALVEKLDASDRISVEIRLRTCRAYIALGDVEGARARLSQAGGLLGDAARFDWRIAWHQGLLELAKGNLEDAESTFMAVRAALPGEDPPKLVLGFCAEQLGRPSKAERYYEAVWKSDRSQVTAAFGLARVRLSSGDPAQRRAAAVEVLDEVRDEFRHIMAARIASVRVLCGRLEADGSPENELPAADDLANAVKRLSVRPLDGTRLDRDSRRRLMAAICEVALGVRRARPDEDLPGNDVFGDPPTERVLRERFADTLRGLAGQARDAQEHGVLMDRANSVRPLTWW